MSKEWACASPRHINFSVTRNRFACVIDDNSFLAAEVYHKIQDKNISYSDFQYHSIDNSIFSTKVMHPFWNYCVQVCTHTINQSMQHKNTTFF